MPVYHSHLRVEADVTPDVLWKAVVSILGFNRGGTGIYGFGEMNLRDGRPFSGARVEIVGNKGSRGEGILDLWEPERMTCKLSRINSDELAVTQWEFRVGSCGQEGRSFVELDILNDCGDTPWRERIFDPFEKQHEVNLARDYHWSFQQRIPQAELVKTFVERL